jgi:2-methylcitrate dehydratase PrpD
MARELPDVAVAEDLARAIASIDTARIPGAVRETCERLLLDVAGLCLVARNSDYVAAARACLARSRPGHRDRASRHA